MILTDEDVKALKLEVYGPHKCAVEVDALRTVLVKMTESAVLEKLRQQEPVAWAVFADNGNIRIWTSASETMQKLAADEGMELIPLYAAPVIAAVSDMQIEELERQRDELLVALEMNGGVYAWCDDMEVLRRIEAVITSVKGSA